MHQVHILLFECKVFIISKLGLHLHNLKFLIQSNNISTMAPAITSRRDCCLAWRHRNLGERLLGAHRSNLGQWLGGDWPFEWDCAVWTLWLHVFELLFFQKHLGCNFCVSFFHSDCARFWPWGLFVQDWLVKLVVYGNYFLHYGFYLGTHRFVRTGSSLHLLIYFLLHLGNLFGGYLRRLLFQNTFSSVAYSEDFYLLLPSGGSRPVESFR